MSLIVTLDESELIVIDFVAALRTTSARGNRVRNAKMGLQSDRETDREGVTAEWAFGKHYNVCPDFSAYPRRGGYDLLIDGYRWDVKATRHKGGHLLATLKKADHAEVDLFALGIVDGNTVTFPGWATRDELIRDENIRDFGHGPGYALAQSQLRKFRDRAEAA